MSTRTILFKASIPFIVIATFTAPAAAIPSRMTPLKLVAFSNPVEIEILPEDKSAVQVEGGKEVSIEKIIEAVRQAQRPCENMRVEWTWEPSGEGIRTVAASRPTAPAKKGGWTYSYTAVRAGIRSRVDLRAEYYPEGSKSPSSSFTEVGVFDGTKFKSLNKYTSGNTVRKPRGTIYARDMNSGAWQRRLFHNRDEFNLDELRKKYEKLVLTDGKEKNVYILDLVTKFGSMWRVTIDGNRGFNVTKVERIRSDGTTDYEIDYQVKQYDGRKWFTGGYEFVRYPRPGKDGACIPVVERKAVVKRVEFDIDVREQMFELDFPDGAEVHDRILNLLYFTGPGEDRILEMPGDLPDYSDLKSAIEAAHAARGELFENSRGKAKLTLEKNGQSEQATGRLQERIRDELGIDPRKMGLLGKATWTVDWYNKGLKKRYDMLVEKGEESAEGERPLLLPQNKRIAVDGRKGIHYNVWTKEAYINKASIRTDNPTNLSNYFRIERLYRCSLGTLPEMLTLYEEHGNKPTVSREKVDGQYCIKLEYTSQGDLPSGKKYNTSVGFWVVPQRAYALVKAEFRSSRRTGGGEPTLLEGYYASYEESDKFQGIWLLKNITMVDNQGPLKEKLTASLSDTEVGIEIPDSTFTFEGLGVPSGTRVYDKSLGGQPIQYSYP